VGGEAEKEVEEEEGKEEEALEEGHVRPPGVVTLFLGM
jgi:hypothetical protein